MKQNCSNFLGNATKLASVVLQNLPWGGDKDVKTDTQVGRKFLDAIRILH